MTTATTRTTAARIVDRMRAGMADMRYAQLRVFENRTGIPAGRGASSRRRGIASTPAELEALYALDLRRDCDAV